MSTAPTGSPPTACSRDSSSAGGSAAASRSTCGAAQAVTGERAIAIDPVASAPARRLLDEAGNIVRDGPTLDAALRALADPSTDPTHLVAASVLGAAAARRESRGSHMRRDFPETRRWWERRVVVRLDESGVPSARVRTGQESAA